MEAREVTRPSRRAASQRLAVLVLYAAGFLQGLTLVCVPALSAALKETLGISDSRYGILFLPQVGCTALAALLGGVLARRLGLKRLLWLSLLANAISQSAVSASPFFAGAAAFAVLLAATSTLGLAFGLSSAPLNTYPLAMFPQRRDAALVALHTALGLGLAAGPLLAASFLGAGAWEHFPLWLAISSGALALLAAAIRFPPTDSIKPPEGSDFSTIFASPLLWLFVAIAILYAFAEGTFSNWAVIYLQEDRGVAPATAAVALSVFWGALAVGRLLVSVLVLKLEAERIWLALPVLMGVAFLLVPLANSASGGIAVFGFAGLACSAFFPLTIARASASYPGATALIASVMIAALMLGVGIGTFVVAPLRGSLPLAELYLLSALYPLTALVLAFVTLRVRWTRPSP